MTCTVYTKQILNIIPSPASSPAKASRASLRLGSHELQVVIGCLVLPGGEKFYI